MPQTLLAPRGLGNLATPEADGLFGPEVDHSRNYVPDDALVLLGTRVAPPRVAAVEIDGTSLAFLQLARKKGKPPREWSVSLTPRYVPAPTEPARVAPVPAEVAPVPVPAPEPVVVAPAPVLLPAPVPRPVAPAPEFTPRPFAGHAATDFGGSSRRPGHFRGDTVAADMPAAPRPTPARTPRVAPKPAAARQGMDPAHQQALRALLGLPSPPARR